MTPYATYGFDVANLMWVYDSPDFMPSCDRIITLNSSPDNKFHATSRRRDILLTLQVIINGGYTVCVSTYFMFLRPYYVPYTVTYNAIDILLCVFWNGKNPLVHLFFNRYVRKKFVEDIRNRKVSSLVFNAFLRLQHKIFPPAHQASTGSLPLNRILKGDCDCSCQCGPRLK
ncbi:unnamed protein product [Litomosoides sigmodontis]|uniref:7TM GPCR serpentine receptor class x (Srx) domain-containing protein n=1 Tax=Litomosoides sigmodontis TaxID=42156 RepID=A0A3P6RYC3_LITSI|nr:unnamed protein product [Litomosoides sigmodontis]